MKCMQEHPREYALPSAGSTCYVFNNLSQSSPLCRFLIAFYAAALRTDHDLTETSKDLYALQPAPLLVGCFIINKRRASALECSECRPGGTGASCQDKNHKPEDLDQPCEMDLCTYHEHVTVEEEKLCRLRWQSMASRMGIND